MIKIICVKKPDGVTHNMMHRSQKMPTHTHTRTHTYMDTHPEKAVEMPIINQVKVTALMLQSHL